MNAVLVAFFDLVLWVHEHTWCVAVQARGVNGQITTTYSGTIDVGSCACGLARVWDTKGSFRSGMLLRCK